MDKYFFKGIPFYVFFILITLIPALVLSYYNHPSPLDDYCFAYMTRDCGFWESQIFYYNGWTGRYCSTFFAHATLLSYNIFWGVKVASVLILFLLTHSFSMFLREILGIKKYESFLISLLFVSVLVAFSSHVFELLYWYTVVSVYPLSIIYWLYFSVFLNRHYAQNLDTKSKVLGIFMMSFLAFCMVGTNEITMLFLLVFLGFVWLMRLIYFKKVDFLLIFLMSFSFCLAYFLVVKAPGTAVRTGVKDIVFNYSLLLKQTMKSLFFYTKRWLIFSPAILFGLVFLLKNVSEKRYFKHFIFQLNPLFTLPANLFFLSIMFFVIHYGNGELVPHRVLNMIFGFFVIIVFYYFIQLSNFLITHKISIANISLLKSLCFVFVLLLWYKADNMKLMYRDILKGTAKKYDQEMLDRYKLIANSTNDTLTLQPLKNVPMSIFGGDIEHNSKHLWNKCYAEFFKKQCFYLKQE